jgi:predicted aldo/keto reductase-like oxidoreductase
MRPLVRRCATAARHRPVSCGIAQPIHGASSTEEERDDMETRRLGKTGHLSTVVTFGTYAIGVVDQAAADRGIEEALARGINHFDIAPTYAEAEVRLGDYLKRHPQPDLFISCKTEKRDKASAREQLLRTLERFGRDRHDLYQLHAVCTPQDLADCFAPGGSMEAILDARQEGLVGHVGITGHGWQSPAVHLAALDRFPFATTMTSCNVFMYQDATYRHDWEALTARAKTEDVGIHVLKATAKDAWAGRTPTHTTWYEPFTEQADVDRAVAFVLHQPVTTLCSAGDLRLFPAICDAAECYREIGERAQVSLVGQSGYGDIFVEA